MNNQTQTKHTPAPWLVMGNQRNGHFDFVLPMAKDEDFQANARLISAAPELLEACEKAIEATLDGVVMKAIKDGTLLENEMHAGLCLLGYIRRKYLKTFENAIAKAKG